MSEKSEKLVKIILPDLLNYLEMVESSEIIEKRQKLKNSIDEVCKQNYKLKKRRYSAKAQYKLGIIL